MTKLTLQVDDKIASVEVEKWDCTATEILDMLVGVMVGQTWLPEIIYETMRDYAEDHLESNCVNE